jgi:hypothetical protein
VWNENPIPNEYISCSGPCVGGIANGQGTLQWHANNQPTDRYVGELGNGRENGQGAYYWPEGARYEGSWKDGKAHGFGTRVDKEGASSRASGSTVASRRTASAPGSVSSAPIAASDKRARGGDSSHGAGALAHADPAVIGRQAIAISCRLLRRSIGSGLR